MLLSKLFPKGIVYIYDNQITCIKVIYSFENFPKDVGHIMIYHEKQYDYQKLYTAITYMI